MASQMNTTKSLEKSFPDSSAGKQSACNAGDPKFNSWVRKIHWRRDRIKKERKKRRDRLTTLVFLDFPCGSASKESTCNVGDLG